ncbi:H-NS histone family protein [Acinetobacter baumannii]|nr:H-NS histone family protein [Acinetobacter baumannii]
MVDIQNLSIDELAKLREDAAVLIEQKKEQALIDAYDQIMQISENVGKSVEELLQYGKQISKKNKAKKPVEPRYRNTKNPSETWTGRGKQPKWLVLEIEKGAKLQDFLIK